MEKFLEFCRSGIPSSVLYPSIIITIIVLLLGLCLKCVGNKTRFILWVLLIEYVFLVISSTVIFRASRPLARIEFIPFWTYYAAANNVFGVSIWDCVLNVVLFMPLGLLVSLLYPSLSLKQVVLIGLATSCCIELTQFLFAKGIMQFDDLMHNTLGCFVGSVIAKFGMKKITRIKDTNQEGA